MSQSIAGRFAFLLAACAFAASASAQAAGEAVSRAAVTVFPGDPAARGSARFRFSGGDGAWFPADRYLTLDAAAGEDREYRLETETVLPDGSSSVSVRSFRIDRKPPLPPVASPPAGRASLPFALALSAESGASVMWARSGSPSFEPWPGRAEIPEIKGLSDYFSCSAYAVDAAGNPGPPATFRWLLSSGGDSVLEPEPVRVVPGPGRLSPLAEAPVPERVAGGYLVRFPEYDQGESVCAVRVSGKPEPSDYLAAGEASGERALFVPVPYGWRSPITVFYGAKGDDGTLFLAEAPLVLMPQEEAPPAPSLAGPDPVFATNGAGDIIVHFVPFPIIPEVRIDSGAWKAWTGPVMLPAKPSSEALVEWRYPGVQGGRTKSARMPFVLPVASISLEGVAPGGLYGKPVRLSKASPGLVRYELSRDGSMPAPVSESSSILPDGHEIGVGEGERALFRLRFRTYASELPGSASSGESLVSFTVDREPPAAPVASLPSSRSYSSETVGVSFDSAEPEVTVELWDSISRSTKEMPYAGVVTLSPPEEGRITYALRAKARDAAGNVSPWSERIQVSLDKTSVYVSESAIEGGRGTPDEPFASLDEAVEACDRTGRSVIFVSGTAVIRRPVEVRGRLSIRGGFFPDFEAATGQASRIVPEGKFALPAFSVAPGATLHLERINSTRRAGDGFPLAESFGNLSARECSFALEAEGGAELISARGGELLLEDCSLELRSGMTAVGVRAADARIRLVSISVTSNKAVMFPSALRVDRSKVEIETSRLVLDASGGSCAVAAADSTVTAIATLVSLSRSAGFATAFSLARSHLIADSCVVDASVPGFSVLVDANASDAALIHCTAILGGAGEGATAFMTRESGFEAVNCLFVSESPKSLLVDGAPTRSAFATSIAHGFASLARDSRLARVILESLVPAGNVVPYERDPKGLPVPTRRSPCVDSGSFAKGARGADFEGKARGDGKPDIGAIEYRK